MTMGHNRWRAAARALVLAMSLATRIIARADAPELAEARKAIDDVRYDDAQRLLIAALEAGGNSPAAVRDIYKLLGASAVALGKTDDAEKYYRAWIVIYPKASLDAGASPKLREPFDAAKSHVVANGGHLSVSGMFTETDVMVFVHTDPIDVATAVKHVGSTEPATPIDENHQAILKGLGDFVVLDRYGNVLLDPVTPTSFAELERAETPYLIRNQPRPEPIAQPKRRFGTTFYALAIPTGVLLATGIGFGTASIVYNSKVHIAIDDSAANYYTDVLDQQKRVTLFWKLSAIVGGAGLVLAIPTAIVYLRSRETTVVPFVDANGAGAAIAGRF